MTTTFRSAALVLSLACLSAGWGFVGAWPVSLAGLVVLLIGLSPYSKKFQFIADLILIYTVLAAATGVWLMAG